MRRGERPVKIKLAEYLERRGEGPVTLDEFEAMVNLLGPVSAPYLRKLLRHSGAPLTPVVEGVLQGNLMELERTLVALTGVYGLAREVSDQRVLEACRRLVIESKNHARWALRRMGGEGEAKREMIEWMLVWLQDPGLFPAWVGLRKKILAAEDGTSQ